MKLARNIGLVGLVLSLTSCEGSMIGDRLARLDAKPKILFEDTNIKTYYLDNDGKIYYKESNTRKGDSKYLEYFPPPKDCDCEDEEEGDQDFENYKVGVL
jgi:hypothetical protein